jgi:hypothetical protein
MISQIVLTKKMEVNLDKNKNNDPFKVLVDDLSVAEDFLNNLEESDKKSERQRCKLAELSASIDEIKQKNETKQDLTLMALGIVQPEIDYILAQKILNKLMPAVMELAKDSKILINIQALQKGRNLITFQRKLNMSKNEINALIKMLKNPIYRKQIHDKLDNLLDYYGR